jgi:hypothetical protein
VTGAAAATSAQNFKMAATQIDLERGRETPMMMGQFE